MADDDVNFEMDASEAYQRLSEKFLKLESEVKAYADEHQEMKGSIEQVVTEIKQCVKMFTEFKSEVGPILQDIAAKMAADRAARAGLAKPPGDPSVN
jgi:cytochrome c551/c552